MENRTQPPVPAKRPLTFADLPQEPGLSLYDLTCEAYREYDFGGRVFRIDNPVGFYMRVGGTTHRVITATGKTYCVPAPGFNGCVLAWENRDPSHVVNF
jgi:hypothetical protein